MCGHGMDFSTVTHHQAAHKRPELLYDEFDDPGLTLTTNLLVRSQALCTIELQDLKKLLVPPERHARSCPGYKAGPSLSRG
jgi:hypothetical protein